LGDALGTEFRVNTVTANAQRRPSTAAAADGAFVVVWDSPDGSQEGIFGQRYDASGNKLGTEFRVNSATTNEQSHASVAIGANGGFVVVWESFQSGSRNDVFGRRYDAAGNTLGTEFRVNSFTPGFQYGPSVASDASGDFVVAWGSSPGGYGAPSYVFGQRYDSNGGKLGSEFTVSSNGSPPSVASDAPGNFVVVWHVWGGYGGNEVYGRRFDSAGAPLGPQFHVNTYDYGYQQRPSVASDASGNFVVAWASRDQDGDVDGIFGQRYDSAGAAQGEEFQISTFTLGPQSGASVAATGTNQFAVVWTSDDQDGSAEGVFGQRLDFTGEPTIHVGDLDRKAKNVGATWRAQVKTLAHDDRHAPESGVLVTLNVSGVGARTCTTTGSGVCEVSVVVSDSVPSLTFTVTNLSKAGLSYDAGANHDPDPDSDGTTIVVNQP
jgi:hypothetical protein